MILAYALLLAAPSFDAPDRFAQLTIQRRVIVRVPTRRLPVPARVTRWKDRRGPECLPIDSLAGAAITGPDRLDVMVRGGGRYRVELDDECSALDFYRGFYVTPTRDGRVCADRDMIRTREGGQCGIDRFRRLVPER